MEPTLYIMMRKDIPDLNPGKGMAQAAHAQADFSEMMMKIPTHYNQDINLENAYNQWLGGRAFGRTLVLEANIDDIKYLHDNWQYSGITVDPSYPWKNFFGEVVLSDIPTCGWAFVFDTPDQPPDIFDLNFHMRLKSLPLHR